MNYKVKVHKIVLRNQIVNNNEITTPQTNIAKTQQLLIKQTHITPIINFILNIFKNNNHRQFII